MQQRKYNFHRPGYLVSPDGRVIPYMVVMQVMVKCKFLYSAVYKSSGLLKNALHFSYLTDRPVHSVTNSTFLGSIQLFTTINA